MPGEDTAFKIRFNPWFDYIFHRHNAHRFTRMGKFKPDGGQVLILEQQFLQLSPVDEECRVLYFCFGPEL